VNVEAMRERLAREREGVLTEIGGVTSLRERDENGKDSRTGDAASETYEREFEVTLEGHANDLLAQYDAALRRVDEGSYGLCASCGGPIGDERLDALPYVAYCIDCARKREAR
jgi:DnaK suppressor protein